MTDDSAPAARSAEKAPTDGGAGQLRRRARLDEAMSVGLVAAAAAASLILGSIVRRSGLEPTRRVATISLSATVPTDWIVDADPETERLLAYSAVRPLRRVLVENVPAANGSPIEKAAADHAATYAAALEDYRVLADGPDALGGRPAYNVEYAYVDPGEGGLPVVIRGLATYVRAGRDIAVIVVEADSSAFESAWPALDDIRRSVSLARGPR